MIKKYHINSAIGVDSVGNALTMQGNCDPPSIASKGVGIYHSWTKTDIELLYVSNGLEKSINDLTSRNEQRRNVSPLVLKLRSDFLATKHRWGKVQMLTLS